MNNHPLTPQEILEERRLWRWWLRWLIKHHGRFHFARICALVTDYLAWVKVGATKKHLATQAQLLKALIIIPKFCNGLIGVSLTDTLPHPQSTSGAASPMS